MKIEEKILDIKCNLCQKFDKKDEFSDREKRQIASITKNTLHFLIKKGIPSTPKNFRRWFNVFTYLAEHNLLEENIPEEKLIDICKTLAKEEENVNSIKIKKELKTTTEVLDQSLKEILQITNQYSKNLNKGDKALTDASQKVNDKELKSVLNYILDEMKKIKKENENFKKKIEEENKRVAKLRKQLQIVETKANTDYLTGLYNRRAFIKIINEYFQGYKEFGAVFSLILFDIDNFKKINDTYGHHIGDEVLKDVANVLKKYLRPEDIPARFGGEEFAVIVSDADKEIASKVAHRLRKVMETRHLKLNDSTVIDYTASFGVASVEEGFENVDQLIKKADDNLYKAKENGKNCVIV
ncbi:MAG: GGDEF domain-containing protein [Aquificae bacterium]|nr:GGDEF domain-containing protein [Aquificota bacterium]